MNGDRTDWTEQILTFGQAAHLVGIHCSPRNPSPARPIVLFLNSGLVHHVGPNRLYVRMAREFARAGISSIRFDLGGIGDSGSSASDSASILDQVERDLSAAIDTAEKTESTGVILLGICSGADNAFSAAVRDPRVVGAVLIDPNAHPTWSFYLHHLGKRIVRLQTWLNLIAGPHSIPNRLRGMLEKKIPQAQSTANVFLAPTTLPPRETMRQQLSELVTRDARLLYVFTGGLEWRYNHRRQLFRAFPGIDWKALAQLEWLPESDHTFSRTDHQRTLVDRICEWLRSTSFHVVESQPESQEVLIF